MGARLLRRHRLDAEYLRRPRAAFLGRAKVLRTSSACARQGSQQRRDASDRALPARPTREGRNCATARLAPQCGGWGFGLVVVGPQAVRPNHRRVWAAGGELAWSAERHPPISVGLEEVAGGPGQRRVPRPHSGNIGEDLQPSGLAEVPCQGGPQLQAACRRRRRDRSRPRTCVDISLARAS